MNVSALSLRDEEAAWKWMGGLVGDELDCSGSVFKFVGWPIFEIEVEGDWYGESMPSSLLHSVLGVQTHLRRVYSSIVYKRSARSLTNEERRRTELFYDVDVSPARIRVDLSEFYNALSVAVANKKDFDSRRGCVSVLMSAAALVAKSEYNFEKENNIRSICDKRRADVVGVVLYRYPELLDIMNDQDDLLQNMIRHAWGASRMILVGSIIDDDVIRKALVVARHSSESVLVEEWYFIRSIKDRGDRFHVELEECAGGAVFFADLMKEEFDASVYRGLAGSFVAGSAVNMKVRVHCHGDQVTSATVEGLK